MRIPDLVEVNGGSFLCPVSFSQWMATLFSNVQPVWGAYDTFCIYFNFKIVLNKFIRLADKLKTTYSLVGSGDLFGNIGF